MHTPPPHWHWVKVTDIDLFCLMKCLCHISQSSENIYISKRGCFHSITRCMPWGGARGQNIDHPHTLVSLSSVVCFFFRQIHFSFIGNARFRRATLSCDSSYWYDDRYWFKTLLSTISIPDQRLRTFMLKSYVTDFRISLFLSPVMYLVHTWFDDRY